MTLIAVVDDDEPVRQGLQALLSSMGYAVRAFASGEELLESDGLAGAGCLVLDINMPGMSGLDLKAELARRREDVPIVFISAYGKDTCGPSSDGEPMTCVLKPFSEDALSAALAGAIAEREVGRQVYEVSQEQNQ